MTFTEYYLKKKMYFFSFRTCLGRYYMSINRAEWIHAKLK